MKSLQHSRIALVVKDNIEVEILEKLMDDELALIWVKIGDGKKHSRSL